MKVIPSLIALVLVAAPSVASSQTYKVQTGDSLSSIAVTHGITIDALARANEIHDYDHVEVGQTLKLPSVEGRLVKNGVMHRVMRGVTLRRIAQAYNVPMHHLLRANRIRNPDILRRGIEIFIPNAQKVVPIATRYIPPCLNEPVEFYRIHTGETLRAVITQCNGSIWRPGQVKVSRFLDRTKEQNAPDLNARLLELVQRVYDHFGKRRIEVVSAFRPPVGEQRASSRHCKAKALDFRVSGMRNERLRDFVRTFNRVGVGYYPNSTFVHLDVRNQSGFWVDWSGPGERPRYGPYAIGDPAKRRQTTPQGQSRRVIPHRRQDRRIGHASAPSPGRVGAP